MKRITKRKSISLGEKLNIINEIEYGASQADTAKKFDLSKSAVQRIWSEKDKIKNTSANLNLNLKKARKCEFPSIDEALIQ